MVNFPPTSYPLLWLKTLNTNSHQASGLKILGSLGEGFAINGTEPRLAVLHPASTAKKPVQKPAGASKNIIKQ